MKELFRIRDYRLLWSGQAVSNFGDALTNLALLLTAQRLTGSVAAVATTAIAVALPTLLFGMVAGAYVDRWNRKRVMIVSDLFRTSFVLLFLLVTTPDQMWLLYTVAFIQAALSTFFNPAKSAFLPRIVSKEQLLVANSVSQMSQIGFGLIGTAVAGIIAATFDTLALAYIIDAGTFLISLTAIVLIRTDGTPERSTAPVRIWTDVRVGIATTARSRVLLGVMIGAGILMFGLGAVNVLLIPFIVDVLAVPETWFAVIEAAQVIPMVLAATLVAVLARRLRPTTIITWALAGLGALVAAISLVQAPWHLMLVLFGVGWLITPLQASVSTLVQTEVEDAVRGRTGAALNTVMTGAQVASMALAGAAAAVMTVRGVFVVAGAIAVVAGLVTAALFKGVSPAQRPEPTPQPAEA
jgi:DHA3 family macrolide efflux protein-like MFS transporter